MKLIDAEFEIRPDQVAPAWATLSRFLNSPAGNTLMANDTIREALLTSKDLYDFLTYLGWDVYEDREGALELLDHDDDRFYSRDEYLLAIIAPMVEPGSYLEVQIEDDYYRWEFQGGRLLEFQGEICWTSHSIIEADRAPALDPTGPADEDEDGGVTIEPPVFLEDDFEEEANV